MSSTNCQFIKKTNRNRQAVRQQQRRVKDEDDDDDSSSSEEEKNVVVTQAKRRKGNPLIQSTSSFSLVKHKSTHLNEDDSEEESKKRDIVSVSYKSDRTGDRVGPSDMGATATIQIETEKEKDAQTIFQKSLEINKELKEQGKEDDRVYRGMNNYVQYVSKKDTPQGNAASGFVRKGPVRAPENIRSTVRWDYQPDLCKDYKETGYCGFGDSCKFMHDRSDYKAGWQIELEMSKGVYGKDDEDADQYKIEDDEDDLPFKCFICRESFKSPVMTKCRHYFCEKCALDHYKKSTRCQVCGVQTGGVFNPAKEIIKRLNQEKANRKEAGEDSDEGQPIQEIGEEDDEDEDDEDEEGQSLQQAENNSDSD